ncbi:glycosyltransferase family 2 protein [Patescibacteria group bacterium]|nr:glycosyltransferase family 2 protein [Patescibacteria group bacterium]
MADKNSYLKFYIIILNWNGLKKTTNCLDSLRLVAYPNYEIVVVDNGSKNQEAEILQNKFGDYIHVIKNSVNLGYVGGNNTGLGYALNKRDADYFLLLNNDTIVEPNLLSAALEVFKADFEIGLCGPKIKYFGTNKIWWAGAKVYRGTDLFLRSSWRLTSHLGKRKEDTGQFDQLSKTDYVTGCALFVRRKVVEAIGLLDNKFFSYGEDLDWSLRAQQASYKLIYFPFTTVYHVIPLDDNTNKKLGYLLFKGYHYLKGVILNLARHYHGNEILLWGLNLIVLPFCWLYNSLRARFAR